MILVAHDIKDLLEAGSFTSEQLFVIEVAARKARSRLGPHQLGNEVGRGKTPKRLHRRTPEEISEDLKERAQLKRDTDYRLGTKSHDPVTPSWVDTNPAPESPENVLIKELEGSTYPPSARHVTYNGIHYKTSVLEYYMIGREFTTGQYPSLKDAVCKVEKINRTRAVVSTDRSARCYTVPLTGLVGTYISGGFK